MSEGYICECFVTHNLYEFGDKLRICLAHRHGWNTENSKETTQTLQLIFYIALFHLIYIPLLKYKSFKSQTIFSKNESDISLAYGTECISW